MDEKTQRKIWGRLANIIAASCVQDTLLKDLHAGKKPVSKTGDYSDVKVIDGEGQEIPWSELSRINDDEMKKLMKQVVNRLYTFYRRSDDSAFQEGMESWGDAVDAAKKWPTPELDDYFDRLLKKMN